MPLEEIDPRQRAWVEVFPEAIKSNAKAIKKLLPEKCLLMAVVKADGYGHGAETVSTAALEGGASMLGVATLQEAKNLREANLTCPILVLGNLVEAKDLETCLNLQLIPTLSSAKEAKICQKLAKYHRKNIEVHIKVDTGMTRLGCALNDSLDLINLIEKLSNISIKGIYSHLALADIINNNEAETFTLKQKEKFESLLNKLGKRKESYCLHLANSAATLNNKDLHYNMVRVGLALYGYSPFGDSDHKFDLKPALAVRAKVTLIRDVALNTGVSYGYTFTTQRKSKLAVVGIGYADGISRALSGKMTVLINGKYYPQVGSITMDQLLIDITDNPNIKVGSIVTLLGIDRENSITPYNWSQMIGTIPWEVLCSFKYRLPRVVM